MHIGECLGSALLGARLLRAHCGHRGPRPRLHGPLSSQIQQAKDLTGGHRRILSSVHSSSAFFLSSIAASTFAKCCSLPAMNSTPAAITVTSVSLSGSALRA